MLPPQNRLRRTSDFKAVYSRGRSYVDRLLVVYVLKTDGDEARIGFSVSKKLGGSVVRNRIRRRLREAARRLLPRLAGGFDIVIVARTAMSDAEYPEIQKALEGRLALAKVLKTDPQMTQIHTLSEP